MLRRLLKKRWPVAVLVLILVLSAIGVVIGRNTPSKSVFAHVQADENGTQIEFFLANSSQIPTRFTCRMQGRTLKVDLRTSIFGDSVGSHFHIGIPADSYDEIVIRCNGQLVPITE